MTIRVPVNEGSFYRSMTILPIVVPLIASVLTFLLHVIGSEAFVPIENAAFYTMMSGAYATVPYALFLAAVHFIVRPTNRRSWQRVIWLAPVAIGIPFAGFFFFAELFAPNGRGGQTALALAAFWGELAIGTGYAYVLIIVLLERLFRRRGWIEATATTIAGT